MSIRRRIGRFYVARPMIEANPQAMMAIMAKCIIVECSCRYRRDEFEYWALSPEFDEIEVGEIEHDYAVTIEEVDEKFNVSFKRVSA